MPDIFVSSNRSNDTSPSDQKKTDLPVNSQFRTKATIPRQALSSYLFMPEGISFETQEPGETIILLLRMHWITNIVWLFIAVILLILPLVLFPGLTLLRIIPSSVTGGFITFVIFTWYLLSFTYILVNFLHWYFNVWIVTQERIIDIEFVNLLSKKFAETRVVRVEDVTMRTGGFIRSVFDYGDVFIQTAAKEAVFYFLAVPHPEEVVKIVNQLMGIEEEGGNV